MSLSFVGDSDDDEEWNAPSSQRGETLRAEIASFEARAAEAFRPCSGGGDGGDDCSGVAPGSGAGAGDGGYTLEQGRLHREFAALVEGRVEGFLASRGFTAAGLIAALRRAEPAANGGSASWTRAAGREVAELLLEVRAAHSSAVASRAFWCYPREQTFSTAKMSRDARTGHPAGCLQLSALAACF